MSWPIYLFLLCSTPWYDYDGTKHYWHNTVCLNMMLQFPIRIKLQQCGNCTHFQSNTEELDKHSSKLWSVFSIQCHRVDMMSYFRAQFHLIPRMEIKITTSFQNILYAVIMCNVQFDSAKQYFFGLFHTPA